jgi:hypothetical protein
MSVSDPGEKIEWGADSEPRNNERVPSSEYDGYPGCTRRKTTQTASCSGTLAASKYCRTRVRPMGGGAGHRGRQRCDVVLLNEKEANGRCAFIAGDHLPYHLLDLRIFWKVLRMSKLLHFIPRVTLAISGSLIRY